MSNQLNMENLSEIMKLLETLLKRLEAQNPCPEIRREWIPKQELQSFLGFASTQMATHEKNYKWVYTIIGKQKFYSTKSVSNILNKNIRE